MHYAEFTTAFLDSTMGRTTTTREIPGWFRGHGLDVHSAPASVWERARAQTVRQRARLGTRTGERTDAVGGTRVRGYSGEASAVRCVRIRVSAGARCLVEKVCRTRIRGREITGRIRPPARGKTKALQFNWRYFKRCSLIMENEAASVCARGCAPRLGELLTTIAPDDGWGRSQQMMSNCYLDIAVQISGAERLEAVLERWQYGEV